MGLAMPTHRCLRCAKTTHLPHVGVVVEAVMVLLLPFRPCFMSSCQANQKHCACRPPLVEQEVQLVTGNYKNGTPRLATGSHLHSPKKRKSKSHSGLS
jgi:hypothetical protein